MGIPSETTPTPTPVRENQVYFWHPEFWEVYRNNRTGRSSDQPRNQIVINRHRATFAWRLTSSGAVEYSIAFCAPEDSFNKARGRSIAQNRLAANVLIRIENCRDLSAHQIRMMILHSLRSVSPHYEGTRQLQVPRGFNHWVTGSDYDDTLFSTVRDSVTSFVTGRPIGFALRLDEVDISSELEQESVTNS